MVIPWFNIHMESGNIKFLFNHFCELVSIDLRTVYLLDQIVSNCIISFYFACFSITFGQVTLSLLSFSLANKTKSLEMEPSWSLVIVLQLSCLRIFCIPFDKERQRVSVWVWKDDKKLNFIPQCSILGVAPNFGLCCISLNYTDLVPI